MSEPTITAAEIARIAGVGPAAVSNWRRRYPEFPIPVGGTAGSPLFSLSEVVDWLEGNGKAVRLTPADEVWRAIEAVRDPGRPGAILAVAGFRLLGEEPPEHLADRRGGAPALPAALGADIDGLGERLGLAEAFEALLIRWTEAHARQVEVTPTPVAELMCALAHPAGGTASASVLDPACGTGGLLLRSAESGVSDLLGQDLDPDLAQIAAVRLRLHGHEHVSVRSGDSLVADAHPTARVRSVVCNPPSGQWDWGRAALGYDARWVYGVPPKAEPELAWLQHALARLGEEGRAVLLMPAGVATRPSGRRIRAELVRRGALRAVVALPAGSSRTPGTHLWLAEPAREATPPGDVLFIDAELFVGGGVEPVGAAPDWDAVRTAVASVWHRFRAGGAPDADFASSVPVTTLLGVDVDVTPARHVRADVDDTVDLARLETDRAGWSRSLSGLPDALPAVRPVSPSSTAPVGDGASAFVSLDGLIRTGILRMWRGSPARETTEGNAPRVPLLALEDGLARTEPGRHTYAAETELIREGDVLVFSAAPESARPADAREYGAAAGQGVTVLRPEPGSLDPWFLAGSVAAGAGAGRSGVPTATTGRRSRLDTEHLLLPVRSAEEQRRIGRGFREIARFDEALTVAVEQGRRVARRLMEALAAGLVDTIDDGRA
ncbi:N-6 DNA methylase [Streptomyces sp. NPDC047097]|uniref:N-6 DNA methylase n=1 Tax=Streptomyces sp. NPDC047097 TaxID=3155260 RepID=UPI00340127C9